ncbi:MAG: hypothetical protein ACFB4I_21280 [Cyanophyceae cyanobacterium]
MDIAFATTRAKPMSYSDYKTISQIREQFPEYQIIEDRDWTTEVQFDTSATPSSKLIDALDKYVPLAIAINTEKARSELIITPVLLEVRETCGVGYFSGVRFDVDEERGLKGYCDYLLTLKPEMYEISVPLLVVVEAKNESIKSGLAQCMAELIAASVFNQNNSPMVIGAVTTGTEWKFLKLAEQTIYIDRTDYFLKNELAKILDVLLFPFLH